MCSNLKFLFISNFRCIPQAYSIFYERSKVERFAKWPLSIFAKNSILDVGKGFEYAIWCHLNILKNVKSTHGGVLLSKVAGQATFFHASQIVAVVQGPCCIGCLNIII